MRYGILTTSCIESYHCDSTTFIWTPRSLKLSVLDTVIYVYPHRMQRARRTPRRAGPTALLPRAPVPQDASPRPTTSTTRRRTSHKDDNDDNDHDDDKHSGDGSSTTTRRKKPKTSSATIATLPSDAFLIAISSGTIATFDSAAFAPGGSASLVQAAATGSALADAAGRSTQASNGLSAVALYGIIGGGAAVALIAVVGILLYCLKRRREKRDAANWPGYSPDGVFRTSIEGQLPGPGKGPGARGQKIDDEAEIATLEKYGHSSISTPIDEKHLHELEYGYSTPRIPQQQQKEDQHAPLSPSHPDYKPPRPPRPSEQYSFASSPIKTVTHHQPPSHNPPKHTHTQSQGLNTYQRNLLALTSSMSFEATPSARARTTTASGQAPARDIAVDPSPFADSEGVPQLERKPSRKSDHKKDTIIVRSRLPAGNALWLTAIMNRALLKATGTTTTKVIRTGRQCL